MTADLTSLPAVAWEMLESVYQHRLLTTAHLRALHTPTTSARWTQRQLASLADADLLAFVPFRGALRAWYVTEAGADLVEQIASRAEPRRHVLTPQLARGPLQAHTLAVNDVGAAFVTAAREREHDCGPLSWRHEVPHATGQQRRARQRDSVIADAVLTYISPEDDGGLSIEYRFIEIDRATMPIEQLAAKLGRYARLYRQEDAKGDSAWHQWYPTFPAVLIALTGRLPQPALEQRLRTALALCQSEPDVQEADGLSVAFVLLDDLITHGPWAPIFVNLADPSQYVDWRGDAASAARISR